MNPDLEIARAARLRPIHEIAAKLGIPPDAVEPYGRHKAKITLDFVDSLQPRPDGALVLVTASVPLGRVRARRPPPSVWATR